MRNRLSKNLEAKALELAGLSPPGPPLDCSEKEFQAQVIRFAETKAWVVYHTYDSRRCSEGFPDLVFRRGPQYAVRVIVAELKVKKNKPSAEQVEWLSAFGAMNIPAYLWTPDSWTEIVEVLTRNLKEKASG